MYNVSMQCSIQDSQELAAKDQLLVPYNYKTTPNLRVFFNRVPCL